MDGTSDHHVEQDTPSTKKPNLSYCLSFVKSRPEMIMMRIILIIIIIMGHECKRGLSARVERVKGKNTEG
jgi:hypothetical protein